MVSMGRTYTYIEVHSTHHMTYTSKPTQDVCMSVHVIPLHGYVHCT